MQQNQSFRTVYGSFRVSWTEDKILLATKRNLELYKAEEILEEIVSEYEEFKGKSVEDIRLVQANRYVGRLK